MLATIPLRLIKAGASRLTVPNCLSILMGESLAERIEFVICDAESPKAQVVALKRSGTQNCRMAGRLWREMLFDALANVEPQNGPQ